MPTFFLKNELTEEQKTNWDKAIAQYSKVMETIAQRELSSMTEKDKKKLMAMGPNPVKEFTDADVFKKLQEFATILGNSPGHEKSALFFRLLSGKRVLKHAPPKSYSYPDYEIIESNEGREIPMLDTFDVKTLVQNKNKYTPYKHVVINQSAWKVLEVISPTKVKVTYGSWEDEGFVWELELKEVLASESQSAIICHHDPENEKITTYDVLQKECHYQAIQHFYAIKVAQDEEEFKKYEEKEMQKYADKPNGVFMGNWAKAYILQTLNNGKKMIEDRLEKGLPAYPTEEEINNYAKTMENSYLRDEYYVKDNLLYQKIWMLKRVFPMSLNDEHYLEI